MREYTHTASNGDATRIYVTAEGDRLYKIEGHAGWMNAGYLPSTAAGRYAYDAYMAQAKQSPRRAYRKLHDDYMLEDTDAMRSWDHKWCMAPSILLEDKDGYRFEIFRGMGERASRRVALERTGRVALTLAEALRTIAHAEPVSLGDMEDAETVLVMYGIERVED